MVESFQEEIQQIIEEAEINFDANRFANAAKSFEFLRNKSIENAHLINSMYFTYRGLHSWAQDGNIVKFAKLYNRHIHDGIRSITKFSLTMLENNPQLHDKYALLRIVEQNLLILNEINQRKIVLEKLIKLAKQMLEDEELPRNEKERYCQEIIKFAKELKDDSSKNESYVTLAKIKEEQGRNTLSSGVYDSEVVAAHLIYEASQFYDKSGNTNKASLLKQRAFNLCPNLDKTSNSLVKN